VRLNKFISETGLCSRREADQRIEAGRVTINGTVALLGTQVAEGDEVRVDGRIVGAAAKHVYIALNKPMGITCTTDRSVTDNIIDFINYPQRVFPVGRLDKYSEGLILLTNNGDIVNEILRERNEHEKEYLVTVDRDITDAFIRGMSSGVRILDTVTKRCKVERIASNQFRIVLTQGLNRQIRRMCEVYDYRVLRLQRRRVVNITLDGLAVGKWRYLTAKEVKGLTNK
jgi:23S rRNA pseudouridine2604 synthase